MSNTKNWFIALEGIDGSGKSTQAKLLAERFREHGHRVHITFEPTDNPIGQLIRNIMKGEMEADHKTIAGLFVADRLHHLQNKKDGILKKLDEGCTVITDRYYFSSYAYHGVHMSQDWVIAANALSAELLRPDLNIYIDMKPEVSLQRIGKSRDSLELYETKENLRLVREKYLEAIDKLQAEENIFITDGNRAPELLAKDIWAEIARQLTDPA